jgi:hypothetical protein
MKEKQCCDCWDVLPLADFNWKNKRCKICAWLWKHNRKDRAESLRRTAYKFIGPCSPVEDLVFENEEYQVPRRKKRGLKEVENPAHVPVPEAPTSPPRRPNRVVPDHLKEAYRGATPKQKAIILKYNICQQDIDNMFEEQDGRCALCKEKFVDGNDNIDHCHTTGRVRGLLCRFCNTTLGTMKDDIDRIQNAADYLRFSKGKSYFKEYLPPFKVVPYCSEEFVATYLFD